MSAIGGQVDNSQFAAHDKEIAALRARCEAVEEKNKVLETSLIANPLMQSESLSLKWMNRAINAEGERDALKNDSVCYHGLRSMCGIEDGDGNSVANFIDDTLRRAEVAEAERDALKADLADEVADNVALRATHVTQGTADYVKVLTDQRDALKDKLARFGGDTLCLGSDDAIRQRARAEKAEKALEDAREQAESDELYCGCEHHRPGATAQALWDEDGCCQVCGVDVDPWTQHALVAEAKLARVREKCEEFSKPEWSLGYRTTALAVLAILDGEPT